MTAPHGHARADARNLHLHRGALRKLAEQPVLRAACLALLERWSNQDGHEPSRIYLERWREMLTSWSIERIAEVILDPVRGQALRQSSPLGPTLTPRERWRLLEEANRLPLSETAEPR